MKYKKLIFNRKNLDLVVKSLENIMKENYFTIEYGFAKRRDVSPIGKTADLIEWKVGAKTYRNGRVFPDRNNKSFALIELKSSNLRPIGYDVLEPYILWISPNQIIMKVDYQVEQTDDEASFMKIFIETEDAKSKFDKTEDSILNEEVFLSEQEEEFSIEQEY